MHLLPLRFGNRQIVDDLIHQQLPFPIGITGMHQLIGLFEQLFQDLQLFLAAAARLELPAAWQDGQGLPLPGLEGRIVGLRLHLFEQVTQAPADYIAIGHADVTVPLFVRFR